MTAPPPKAGAQAASAPSSRVLAQFAFEFRLLLRNSENLLAAVVVPVAILVFFSLVPVLPTGDQEAVDFLVPGVLALAVTAAGVLALAISTGFERHYQVLKRLGATPLRRQELIAAKVLAVIGIQLIQLVVVVATGMLLGWRPELSGQGLALGLAGWILGTAACCGLGLALAGRLPALATLAASNGLFLILLLCSGIVFPLDELPAALRAAAELLPVAPMAQLLRAAFSVGQVADTGRHLLVLVVWAALAPAVAARVFRWT